MCVYIYIYYCNTDTHVGGAVNAQALVVETIHLRDLTALVVAASQCDTVRIAHLKRNLLQYMHVDRTKHPWTHAHTHKRRQMDRKRCVHSYKNIHTHQHNPKYKNRSISRAERFRSAYTSSVAPQSTHTGTKKHTLPFCVRKNCLSARVRTRTPTCTRTRTCICT